MFFGYVTLFSALIISGIAAYYSIVGLIAIFAGAALEIAIMGASLEFGKVISTSWLYQNWGNKKVPKVMKIYLTSAVVILMFITSMGIFGFLSKAHLEQTAPTGMNTIRIEQIDTRIQREQNTIDRANSVLAQLDAVIDRYVELDRISQSLRVRQEQREEREALNASILQAQQKLQTLEEERLPLLTEVKALEAEVGPLKYVAELVYGENASSNFDSAVRWVIIIFIFVFNPLAILLLLAANMTLKQVREAKKKPKRRRRKPKISDDNVHNLEYWIDYDQ